MTAYIKSRRKFATFDTETTGLPIHYSADLGLQPRIIEFAGIITDGVEILDTVEFVCNPGIIIDDFIIKLTGLTNEVLEDKPYFENYVSKVKDYFSQADIVIAHNLSFDKSLLFYDLKRLDYDLSSVNWPKIECCSVEQTFHHFGRRMKLSELYEMFIGPYEQKHRALDDIMLLHSVCQKLGIYDAFN
jgi:DNA polymerase III alpha subunit (gram-positive type)